MPVARPPRRTPGTHGPPRHGPAAGTPWSPQRLAAAPLRRRRAPFSASLTSVLITQWRQRGGRCLPNRSGGRGRRPRVRGPGGSGGGRAGPLLGGVPARDGDVDGGVPAGGNARGDGRRARGGPSRYRGRVTPVPSPPPRSPFPPRGCRSSPCPNRSSSPKGPGAARAGGRVPSC